ncbi:unnamed protein product [Sphenostylis stenocarpa]|uniref:Arf-GAP domain-containing protein n=1 Tax=Sphenostylis stenocarpa TaxID=92480 RepID=A0AA86SFR2_9FABA|nr:unnamed protein product [Sphenostylis stenocarpa]
MYQLQQLGTTICMYKLLDFHLHDMQWNTLFNSTMIKGDVDIDGEKKTHRGLMSSLSYFREFTHRVKSVSMAKFTSQEVDALQSGGNQRAREIYLKNWDFQRQRLPDNSNVDKIRDFIKTVYVDGRYAAVKSSEKPPRDAQAIYT